MKQNTYRKGLWFAALSSIGWGISGVCSQYLFAQYGMVSSWLTAIRMIFSGILLLFIAGLQKSDLFAVFHHKSDRLQLIIFAVFGLLLCQFAFLSAIEHSNSGTATVLQSLNVVLMAIVVAWRTRTKLSGTQLLSIALAVFGTYCIATNGNFSEMVISVPGLSWGLLSAVGVVTYVLLSQSIIKTWGNIVIIGWGMLIGGIILGIFVQAWRVPTNLDAFALLIIVVGIIIIGTVVGFSLFLEGARLIGPMKATLIGCLEPVSATVLSVCLLSTSFGAVEILGFCAIMATVLLSIKKTA